MGTIEFEGPFTVSQIPEMTDKKVTLFSRLLPLLRYSVPFFLFGIFFLDVSDWIVNQESTKAPSVTEAILEKQSRIITILAFVRSQCQYFLAASASLSYCIKQQKLHQCRIFLRQLHSNLISFTAERGVSHGRPGHPRRLPERVTFAWTILVFLACLHAFRFIYGTFIDMSNVFLQIDAKKYSGITLSTAVFDIAFGLVMLFAELVPLLLYAGFLYLCSLLTECSVMFNKVLRSVIEQVEMDWYEEGGSKERHGQQSFGEVLDGLSRTSRRIANALQELDGVVSGFIFTVLLGNCLLMASILARCFVSSSFAGVMSYVRYATIFVPPLLSMMLIVNVCAALHETQGESVRKWQDLVVARQSHRGLVVRSDEGEKLLTILHRTTNGHHSLTIAGTAHVTRSFGVSLVCGFVGLICFLIERSEHYETEAAVHDAKSLQLNCSASH
ncbi:hypothetical protein BV898_17159 [Hypsibius exemplaris]|uniref:Uncharacterized protein n=1 Tax=Hypsibius exemplaris TaxID=2072580 RepID=A0A9X6RLR9_HYPEX|nr:hypothetical protein BV898_17159 [Hypsibius exemplaris]